MRATATLGMLAHLLLGCAARERFDPPSGAVPYRDGSIAVVTALPESVARSVIEITKETWRWLDERLVHVTDPTALRVTIFLFSSKADFERGAPRMVYEDRSGKTQDVPRIGLFLVEPREIGVFSGCSDKTGACKHLVPTLRHELVHAFLHAAVGRNFIPSYVDEGLARFFDSTTWPPEDIAGDFQSSDNFLDFEEQAYFGAAPSVSQLLASPISYEALIKGGESSFHLYYESSARLMGTLFRRKKFAGFFPKLLERYSKGVALPKADYAGLASAFRDSFASTLEEFAGSIEDLENEYDAYVRELRPRRFARAFSWKADYVRQATLLDLKPVVDGKEVSFDSLSWEQLQGGEGFTLVRDPSRVLAVRIQDLLRRSGELRARVVTVDAKNAPELLVREVERMVDEATALSDHCALLRSRLGEKAYVEGLRAASRAHWNSERLLENELQLAKGAALLLRFWLPHREE